MPLSHLLNVPSHKCIPMPVLDVIFTTPVGRVLFEFEIIQSKLLTKGFLSKDFLRNVINSFDITTLFVFSYNQFIFVFLFKTYKIKPVNNIFKRCFLN